MEPERHRAVVDTERCLGTGSCVYTDPDRFELSNDGFGQWRDAAEPATEELLRHVAELCPQGAITIANHKETTR